MKYILEYISFDVSMSFEIFTSREKRNPSLKYNFIFFFFNILNLYYDIKQNIK